MLVSRFQVSPSVWREGVNNELNYVVLIIL